MLLYFTLIFYIMCFCHFNRNITYLLTYDARLRRNLFIYCLIVHTLYILLN